MNLEELKKPWELECHWKLRKAFLDYHFDKFPFERLLCLSQLFVNIEILGVKYAKETMKEIELLGAKIPYLNEYRRIKAQLNVQSKLSRMVIKDSAKMVMKPKHDYVVNRRRGHNGRNDTISHLERNSQPKSAKPKFVDKTHQNHPSSNNPRPGMCNAPVIQNKANSINNPRPEKLSGPNIKSKSNSNDSSRPEKFNSPTIVIKVASSDNPRAEKFRVQTIKSKGNSTHNSCPEKLKSPIVKSKINSNDNTHPEKFKSPTIKTKANNRDNFQPLKPLKTTVNGDIASQSSSSPIKRSYRSQSRAWRKKSEI